MDESKIGVEASGGFGRNAARAKSRRRHKPGRANDLPGESLQDELRMMDQHMREIVAPLKKRGGS